MRTYWDAFYSHFNEFASLNEHYESLKAETIIDIKKNNFLRPSHISLCTAQWAKGAHNNFYTLHKMVC